MKGQWTTADSWYRRVARRTPPLILLVYIGGCTGSLYPLTSGTHVPTVPSLLGLKHHYVVWSANASVVRAARILLQKSGHTVVNHQRLETALADHGIRLIEPPGEAVQILKVAQSLGADHVLFATHSINIHRHGGRWAIRLRPVFDLSVTVEAVSTETQEERWRGTAWYLGPVANADAGLATLTQAAIMRATCPIEHGYEWEEFGPSGGGCRKKE